MIQQQAEHEKEQGEQVAPLGYESHHMRINRVRGEKEARNKSGCPVPEDPHEEMEEEQNIQAVEQDVGEMVTGGVQPPKGVVNYIRKRYERPIVSPPENPFGFQLKKRLAEKLRQVTPTPDEMVLDDQNIVIPDKIVLQGVQVNRERDNQENSIRRDRPQGLPGTRRSSLSLGFRFVHGVKKDSTILPRILPLAVRGRLSGPGRHA